MSALFEPLVLRDLGLKNRIVISPMCQYRAREGIVTPWHHVHVGMMALSGSALAIMEASGVEASGRISRSCLGLYNDDQEAALARMLADIRMFSSTPLGIQLAHAGRKAACYPILDNRDGQFPENRLRIGGPLPAHLGWPVEGPSPLAFDDSGDWQQPIELGPDGLLRVRDAFVEAARRADRCGFDMVEIHGGHGYLLHSFVSALSNRRGDAYGGCLQNRIRFPVEVASAVRRAFPAGKPMGYRLNGTDWAQDGVTIEDAIALAGALKEVGIDYVTVSGGGGAPDAIYPQLRPGYMVDLAASVRRATGIATMAVGMILDGPQANEIVTSGKADLVAIGRGFIDDPKWAWHAAYALCEKPDVPGLQARVQPERWPGYHHVHPKPRPG